MTGPKFQVHYSHSELGYRCKKKTMYAVRFAVIRNSQNLSQNKKLDWFSKNYDNISIGGMI